MKNVSIHITGKVQGVFFRASAKEKAEELELKGSARNNADGSVSIEAEGEEKNLLAFIDWCKQGPPFSRVDSYKITENALQNFKDFSIQR